MEEILYNYTQLKLLTHTKLEWLAMFNMQLFRFPPKNRWECSRMEWEVWAELWKKATERWKVRKKISQIADEPRGSCPRCWPEQQHSAGQSHMNGGQALAAAIVIHFTCTSRMHLFPLISRHEFFHPHSDSAALRSLVLCRLKQICSQLRLPGVAWCWF